MKQPIISILAAVQRKDNGIGFKGNLLFRISEDLKRFKAITTGHPIIMGRKTFDSIGRALPHRTNIVITRNPEWKHDGVVAVSSLEEALAKAREIDQEEICIIGGGEIYKLALLHTDRLYLTVVDADKEADVLFPEWHEFGKEIESRDKKIDEATGLTYQYLTLEK